jgi:hypothetical protein
MGQLFVSALYAAQFFSQSSACFQPASQMLRAPNTNTLNGLRMARFRRYLEGGIVNDLRRGSRKSRQRYVAVFCNAREVRPMNMNEDRSDSEPFSLPDLATGAQDVNEQSLEVGRATNHRVVRAGNAPGGPIAASVAIRRPFPLRTLMVCFTIWLIATQAMIFDQIKFEERAQLLEQAARSLGAPQMAVPSEGPLNSSSGAEMQRL